MLEIQVPLGYSVDVKGCGQLKGVDADQRGGQREPRAGFGGGAGAVRDTPLAAGGLLGPGAHPP
eukprot:859709-Prorocentrum_minimum.AAC.1